MKIAVSGGKGGTGKSTISLNLASLMPGSLLIDADVECPDDLATVIMDRDCPESFPDIISLKEFLRDVRQRVPNFNQERCIGCGRCQEYCRSNALINIGKKPPLFYEEMCNGCGACTLVCPNGSITWSEKKIGNIFLTKTKEFNIITGELNIGEKATELMVKETLKEAEKYPAQTMIIDTAAGTHCNVVEALEFSDHVFAVTEPTPVGAHDLTLTLELCRQLDVSAGIILNKENIGNRNLIMEVARKFKVPLVARIPYDLNIIRHTYAISSYLKEIVQGLQ